eukprot:COSAG01_NODE_14208_length_1482_cov_13.550976_1_plen_70_part_00
MDSRGCKVWSYITAVPSIVDITRQSAKKAKKAKKEFAASLVPKLPFPEEEIGGSQLLLGPLERLHRPDS